MIIVNSKTVKFPLSFAERRLWFMNKLVPADPFYNILVPVEFSTFPDVALLEKTLNVLLDRHEIYRSSYHDNGGSPYKLVEDKAEIKIIVHNELGDVDLSEKEKIVAIGKKVGKYIIDIRTAPLMRAVLAGVTEEKQVLYLIMHHMITDKWSITILLKELLSLYTAFKEGKEIELTKIKLNYTDFAIWQHDWMLTEDAIKQTQYWKKKLEGQNPFVEFPTDYIRPAVPSYLGEAYHFEIPEDLVALMRAYSKKNNATYAVLFLSAWNLLVYQYSGIENIVMGTTMGARYLSGSEQVIGCFINILLIRSFVNGRLRFTDLVQQIKLSSIEAYTNGKIPYEYVVEKINPDRAANYMPYSNLYFQFQDINLRKNQEQSASFYEVSSGRSKFDIMLNMWETEKGFSGAFEYCIKLFSPLRIKALAAHFIHLLSSVFRESEKEIRLHSILTLEETLQYHRWNTTAFRVSKKNSIPHLIQETINKMPNAVAVSFGAEQLTYQELDRKVNVVAATLLAMGVRKNNIIAVLMQRSINVIVALLAIFKIGAVYLPLNSNYPMQKIMDLLSINKVFHLFLDNSSFPKMSNLNDQIHLLNIDNINDPKNEAVIEIFESVNVKGDDHAYIMFTSGSTGEPKGSIITYDNLASLLHWSRKYFSIEEIQCVLASTPIYFDLSVFELLLPLCMGGSVRIVKNLISVKEWCDHGVTLINTVPSLMSAFLKSYKKLLASIKTINLAGEYLHKNLLSEIRARNSELRINNLYGLTETTIYSTCCPVRSLMNESINLGRPIDNVQIYLLNKNYQLTPAGIKGEIFIGGRGVGPGVLIKGKLSREGYIKNPFSSHPSDYLFKTGDIGFYCPDGSIQFLKRSDRQVKVNGQRVELKEIEAAIYTFRSITQCFVTFLGEGENGVLCAFIDCVEYFGEQEDELREHLKNQIPRYMVPNRFIFLEKFPLTNNGKVDEKKLKEIFLNSTKLFAKNSDPKTITEEKVKKIWQEELGINALGCSDDFFEVGGHSLVAIRILCKINEKFCVNLPFASIFDLMTIRDVSREVDGILVQQKNTENLRLYWEKIISDIWKDLLQKENFELGENILHFGIDSVVVLKFVARLNSNFGLSLSARQVFEVGSFQELVTRVIDLKNSKESAYLVEPQPREIFEI